MQTMAGEEFHGSLSALHIFHIGTVFGASRQYLKKGNYSLFLDTQEHLLLFQTVNDHIYVGCIGSIFALAAVLIQHRISKSHIWIILAMIVTTISAIVGGLLVALSNESWSQVHVGGVILAGD